MDLIWRIAQLVGSLLIPAVAWLARSHFQVHTRLVRAETRLESTGLAQASDTLRITQNELAIVKLQETLRASTQRSEELVSKLNAICDKIEMLPRIDESLKHLADIYDHVVRREEWEMANRAVSDRLSAVEWRSRNSDAR